MPVRINEARPRGIGRAGRAALAVSALVLSAPSGSAAARAREDGRPNVLFIAIDDLNDWVGFLEGHPQIRTPNMDRLARRGMVFANAQCAAPLCCPSRAALFSGREPFRTGIYHNGPNIRQFHPDLVLIPQYFAAQGYRTFGTGKLLHHRSPELFHEHFGTEQRWSPLAGAKEAASTPEELATETTDPRHVAHYGPDGEKEVVLPLNRMPSDRNPKGVGGESFDWGPFDVDDEAMGDGRITSWAVDRIRGGPERPFLICVGYYRPHIPLWAPRRYFEPYPEASTILPEVLASDLDDLGPTGRRWALEAVTAGAHSNVVEHGQWKAAVAAYLACVSFVDAQIGRLLDALERGPDADRTAIVLWGDHGWHLGEKQHWGKWTGWERATRVPLLIVPPRSAGSRYRRGGRCERPVGLIDLYPTLVDLCGLPPKDGLDGRSLVPLLEDPERESTPAITTFEPGNYSVRDDRWRLIRYEDGSEELYDHEADPNEWKNLAADPRHDAVRARLRERLPESPAPRLGNDSGSDGGG